MAGLPAPNLPVPDGPDALDWTGVSDKPSYYRLFAGYVLAQFATGIATVGLALLAFDLAGEESGTVIGTALSLKMMSYVLGAPILTVMTHGLPRKALLIALDLIRAASLILLPFVSAVWQVNVLVILFATASRAALALSIWLWCPTCWAAKRTMPVRSPVRALLLMSRGRSAPCWRPG